MANEVVVNIKADATKAKAAIGSFQERVKKAADSVRRMGFAVGAMGAAVTFGLVGAANQTSIFQDRIGKMNKATDMSVETLQGLAHAAELGGVSLAAIDTGTRKMARSIAEARLGMAEYAEVFDELGISMEELEGLGMDEAFMKLGEAIAAIEDPIKRSATASELFGRSGQALVPLFEEGITGAVDGSIKMLKEYGQLTGVEGIRASEAYRDALTNLGMAQMGLKTTIGNVLIPELTRLADGMRETLAPITSWVQANPELARGIILVTAGIAAVMIPLGALMVAMPILTGMFTLLLGPVGLVIIAIAALVIAFKKFEIVRKIVKNAVEFILSYWEFMINGIIRGTNQFIGVLNNLLDRFPKLAKVIGTDFIEPLDEVSFSIDGLVGKAKDGFGKVGEFLEGLGTVARDTSGDIASGIHAMAETTTKNLAKTDTAIKKTTDAVNELNLAMSGSSGSSRAAVGSSDASTRKHTGMGDLGAIMLEGAEKLRQLMVKQGVTEIGFQGSGFQDLFTGTTTLGKTHALREGQVVTNYITNFGDTVEVQSTELTTNLINEKISEGGING